MNFRSILIPNTYTDRLNLILLILRITVGVFMLSHGWGKFEKLISGDPIKFSDPLSIGVATSLSLAVFAEVLCSILLMIGFFTRFATIPLLVTMLVAVFLVHWDDPFGKKELPLLYIVNYITIMMLGPGKYSVDNYLFSNKK